VTKDEAQRRRWTFYEAVKLDSAPRSANIMPMIRHFDYLARIYDHFAGRPNLTVLEELLDLPIQGWMLDMGGGTGRVSYPFLAHANKIVIADASLPMLRAAGRKGRLLTVKSLAECLPFHEKSFEKILIVDAFHHFENAQKSLAELGRVLKQGGRIVIEEPDLRRGAVKVVALAEKLAFMKSRFFQPLSILKMLTECGLSARIATSDRFRVWITADKTHSDSALKPAEF
jgi:SAM-dependent methyltransferase